MSPRPPRFWERLLAALLAESNRDVALGDLAEEHALRARASGRAAADRWYRNQSLRSIPIALEGHLAGLGQGADMRRFVDHRIQDLRWAIRSLRRNPSFTVVSVLTLGLGMGAAAAMFTVVDGILLRPLPYAEPDRVVRVSQDGVDGAYWLSAPNYADLEEQLEAFTAIAAYSPTGANMVVEGEPERINAAEVTRGFFETLGVEPAMGRTPSETEARSVVPVAVISHGVWERRLGSRPDAVGATLVLDGVAHEVIGVLPDVPMVPAGAEVWIPIDMSVPDWRARRGIQWIQVIARLSPGATLASAQAEADALESVLRESYPDVNGRMDIALRSLVEMTVGPVRTELGVLMGAVGLVLLVAAVNVSGLLVARTTARQGEIAVRTALGGARKRLASQLVTETVLIAALGGAIGLVLARFGVAALVRAAPAGTPRLSEVGVGGVTVLFVAAVSLGAAFLFGPAPALQALRASEKRIRRGSSGDRREPRLRSGLVIVQVALAMALLAGAGLLGKSLLQLIRIDPGYRAEGALVAGLPVVESQFPTLDARRAHFLAIEEGARALPGVTAAGLTNTAPFAGFGPVFNYELPDLQVDPNTELLARYRVVTPEVFAALDIPVVRGAGFTPETVAPTAERVAVVSEEMARRFFADRDPVGERLLTAGDTFRIAGVVGAIRDGSLTDPSPYPHVYVPLTQAGRQNMLLVLRTSGDPEALVGPLRQVVREIDPGQPLTPLRPLAAFLSDSVARSRFVFSLLAFFAGSTVLLASVGLYGLLSFTVGRRTREIGIRMALGANASKVRRLVVAQGLKLAAIGLPLGLGITLLAGRFVETLLYDVTYRDPVVLGVMSLGLLAVTAFAAWVPARRAVRIAPQEALRSE